MTFLVYPVSVFVVPLYATGIGIDLASVAMVMFLARLVPVVLEPIVGRLSDMTTLSLGRRRSWILLSIPLILIGTNALLRPTDDVTILYFSAALIVFYVGDVIIQNTYTAWVGEQSEDYDGRSQYSGTRTTYGLIGMMASAAVIAFMLFTGNSDDSVLAAVFWITAATLILGTIMAFIAAHDSPATEVDQRQPTAFATEFRVVRRNGPLARVLSSNSLMWAANAFMFTLSIFYMRNVIQIDTIIGLIYLGYFGLGWIALSAWFKSAMRYEKHYVFAASLLLQAITSFLVWPLEASNEILFTLLFFCKGACFGASRFLVPSLTADTSDVDRAMTRQFRLGFLTALVNMSAGVSMAFAEGIALAVLSLVGFEPNSTSTTTDLQTLAFLYCVVPGILYTMAAAMLFKYPLSRRRTERLQTALNNRR